MAFHYHFGGVELISEIAFPALRASRAEGAAGPLIRVVEGQGEAPAEDKFHFAWDGRLQMRLGESGGEWRVGSPWGAFVFDRDVSTVRVFGSDGPNLPIVRDMFVRRLLPRLIGLKGGWTYHAASLARNDKALLIIGTSGAGKSTMSVGLGATEGWDVLGDDMALVWNEGAEVVAPASADVTIWSQSCAGLRLPKEDCEPLPGYDGKYIYRPRRARRLDAVPLGGVLFLNRTACDGPRLDLHTRAEAFQLALSQRVLFNPSGSAAEERVRSVTRLNGILGRTPAWTLTYPPSFAVLPAVSDLLSSALEG
ncbi:MAG TPA: hypothetical protein VF138_01775 [Caulobacteraceae bacterium]